MKKYVNLRLPVLFACLLASGIAAGYLFIINSIELFWIIAAVPIAAVIIILSLFFAKGLRTPIIIAICAVIFIIGAVACFTKIKAFEKSELNENTLYSFSATVCDKGQNARGEYIVLKNVVAGDIKINGKMIVYLGEHYGDYCETGYSVRFTSTVNKNKAFPYGKPNYYLGENVKYSCFVYSGVTAKEGFSLFGRIRTAVRDSLYENLDNETAAISLGILTGNTQFIEDGALNSFRYGGIAHMFAVSGLHIGIIYGMFYFLCKRLRLNALHTILLCVIPVFLYAGICGFTLSSLRAAIMCTVSLTARKTFKKYDGLNSLAISVIIILFINPVNILSTGFQLSLCAVGGIALLSKRLTKRLKKLPRKISETVSVSLSAQAGTLPVMLANFGYISGAGLLLNIIVVPLLSVEFAIMLICTAISLIMPFSSSFILSCASLPLQATVSFFIDAGFENALIKGFGAGIFLPLYYFGLAVASDKINIKPLLRIITVACAAVVLIVYTLIKTFIPFNDYKITVSAYYGGGEVLIKSREGNVLIITENITATRTGNFLNNNYATRLNAVILLGGEECAFGFSNLMLDCDTVYVYYGYIPVQPLGDAQIYYEKSFAVCGINFEFADGYSVTANCGGIDIGVCGGKFVPFDICDLLICDVADNGCASEYTVSFNERNIPDCVYDCGDFDFYINNGKLR